LTTIPTLRFHRNKKAMVAKFEDLTDAQWDAIKEHLPVQRLRKHDLRVMMNAIFWVLRVGAQWRNLDSRFPKWTAVYYYFRAWPKNGTIEKLNASLNEMERKKHEKEATPSLVCVDSQSVKLAAMIFEDRGTDGGKKVNGRKRQVMVDTLGLVHGASVHAANLSDTIMGCQLFEKVKVQFTRLKKILVDASYQGTFVNEAKLQLDVDVEISSRPPTVKGFVPLAKRWVSERTFGWTNFFRRVTKDYEHTTKSAETMILLMNCAIILNRIKT
jgi:putative transposase